jgi:hypothetical protein
METRRKKKKKKKGLEFETEKKRCGCYGNQKGFRRLCIKL